MTEDEKQALVTRKAAEAVGEWLIAGGLLGRRVNDLRQEDLEGIVTAAISAFVAERSRIAIASINSEVPQPISP